VTHLVLGGTGTVGGRVVEELVERGEDVRVLTRSPEKAGGLPGEVEVVGGDLGDPPTLDGVFAGTDRLFLLNAVVPTELQEGLVALSEARRAGVRRIVYLSVQDAGRGPHIPHFASKVALEEAVRRSGIRWTVLRPNNFYQNDVMFREALVEHGVYPQPIGSVGLSRVDVRDIARAAARALTGSGYAGSVYTLAGPEPLTGDDCARIWGEALGKEVRYAGDDLDAWEEQALEMLPAWMVYDFRLMYAMFQEEGLAATPEQLEETREILGREPTTFRAWTEETAADWT
jgi:uncharacterized protein YbjT (DUF2867 family)